MDELKEQKIKVLNIDVEEIKQGLEELGANKVYEGVKIITTLNPISNVSINRISYELGKIVFNIDTFPLIPPFLEIDEEFLEEEGYPLDELLSKLGLAGRQTVIMGTEDIHKFHGINYFDAYKIQSLQEDSSETYKGPSK